jgi:hypothetical protein
MEPLKRLLEWRPLPVAAVLAAVLPLLLPQPVPLSAQGFDAPSPGDTIYELSHMTGGRAIGWITQTQGDTVVFRSLEGGEWRLHRQSAQLRRARGTVVRGEFWREDQNHSRLFFAPTGRPLHEGQAYIGLFAILPFVGGGVTDDLTMAGGFNPFGGELANTAFWIAPKYRVHAAAEQQIAVGGFYLNFPDVNLFEWDESAPDPDGEATRLAIAYGVGTFGGLDQALHAGAGVARQFGSDPRTRLLGMVGGEYRMSRRWKLLSENWIMLPDYPMVSIGFRSIGDRWTWDWGFMALLGEEGAPYFPIFSFSYAFGAGR